MFELEMVVAGEAQVAFEVKITDITSPFAKVVLVKKFAPVLLPTLTPLTLH
jgi:hypothetical protein